MHYFCFIFLLTVSVPDYIRLVFFHSGINDDSAAQTQSLAFTAKGYFEFVNDGCSKGNTMLRAETICKRGIKKTLKNTLELHSPTFLTLRQCNKPLRMVIHLKLCFIHHPLPLSFWSPLTPDLKYLALQLNPKRFSSSVANFVCLS